jgi:hypothetical protein
MTARERPKGCSVVVVTLTARERLALCTALWPIINTLGTPAQDAYEKLRKARTSFAFTRACHARTKKGTKR